MEFSGLRPSSRTKPREAFSARSNAQALLQVELSENFRENYHPGLHIAAQEVLPKEECSDYLNSFRPDDKSNKYLICTRNIDGTSCEVPAIEPFINLPRQQKSIYQEKG